MQCAYLQYFDLLWIPSQDNKENVHYGSLNDPIWAASNPETSKTL